MNLLLRCTAFTCLLLASMWSAAAQNSSLMRRPANVPGYRPPTSAPAPPLPPESHSAIARRYDPWAQVGPSPGYSQQPGGPGNGYGDEGSGPYGGADPYGADSYDPMTERYDPYQRAPRPAVSLNEASWTYQPAPPVRVIQRNDVITIRVDEITRMMAEGTSFNRKRTLAEVILTDWIRVKDFRVRPDPQDDGDPAIAAESNNNFRAQSMLESRESLTFNIAATVVDIRPNGNLVLEARKAIRVNDNLWETSLTGMCRAEDIAPDNVVLSKDLIDLEIRKEDRGHLKDAYSRGWLQRLVDRFGPF